MHGTTSQERQKEELRSTQNQIRQAIVVIAEGKSHRFTNLTLSHKMTSNGSQGRDVSRSRIEEASKPITIDIRDYYELKEMSVVDGLIDILCDLSHQFNEKNWLRVRGLVRYFKLILQYNSLTLIEAIHKGCKIEVLTLLKNIP